jgi:hypothetical protein
MPIDMKSVVLQSFHEWCELNSRPPNDEAIAEFTLDMDGTFGGVSATELSAFIRSDPRFQS